MLENGIKTLPVYNYIQIYNDIIAGSGNTVKQHYYGICISMEKALVKWALGLGG